MRRRPTLLIYWRRLNPLLRFSLLAAATPVLALNVWVLTLLFRYFHSLFVILIGASLLAFLLNYPVTWMVQQGAKRERAAIMVFLLALSIMLALGVTLMPVAIAQAYQLFHRLPEWIDSGRHQLLTFNDTARGLGLPFNLDSVAIQINDRLKGQLQGLAGEVLSLIVLTVSSLLDFLLTIVLTFYLLQHGEELWNSLMSWFPAHMQQPFSQTLRRSFQNFFLGQSILATCMASALTLIFLILGVPFGLLFGLIIGTMALVPFGGTVGIFLITLLVTLRDAGLGLRVFLAAFVVQQILENVVAPRVLGKVTGLNPVWVLVSVLTGARIGGILGVLVSVPTAVVIKSLLTSLRAAATLESGDRSTIFPPTAETRLALPGDQPVSDSLPP